MTVEQLVEKRKVEIEELLRLQFYIQVLKENVGLTDETINEMLIKISFRIAQCEDNIREYQRSLV
jgi:hypothetical protein